MHIFPVIMSLCDYLSVYAFSLGKKLIRQEDQKLFLKLCTKHSRYSAVASKTSSSSNLVACIINYMIPLLASKNLQKNFVVQGKMRAFVPEMVVVPCS